MRIFALMTNTNNLIDFEKEKMDFILSALLFLVIIILFVKYRYDKKQKLILEKYL